MAKITAMWDQDENDRPILVLTKETGGLSLSEVQEFLIDGANGSYNGVYVMAINAAGWYADPHDNNQWILYPVQEGENCPICGGRV